MSPKASAAAISTVRHTWRGKGLQGYLAHKKTEVQGYLAHKKTFCRDTSLMRKRFQG